MDYLKKNFAIQKSFLHLQSILKNGIVFWHIADVAQLARAADL